MTSKGDRCPGRVCACVGYDRTRGNVALAKLGNALGVKLDASQPDHVLLEQLAEAAASVPATIERAFQRGRESATHGGY